MTVELERKFYKWYKRINISCDEQKTTNRWDGIQNAVGLFENLVDISGLWHSVIQTEMPIKFKLKRMEKDTQYLYSLEKKWLAVHRNLY